jgi:AcrR family transcriptional regulator
MNPVFLNLPDKKRDAVIKACMDEFSANGFDGASTNRIVQKLGIAKGSLFSYFNTKENLYYFVLENAINKIYNEVKPKVDYLCEIQNGANITDRFYSLTEICIDTYLDNPNEFKLFMTTLESRDLPVSEKLSETYSKLVGGIYINLFRGVRTDNLKVDFEDAVKVLKWVAMGFKDMVTAIPALKKARIKEFSGFLKRLSSLKKSGLSVFSLVGNEKKRFKNFALGYIKLALRVIENGIYKNPV